MGTRTPNSQEWWEKETAFIEMQSVSWIRMGEFSSYCSMQARFADKDGFPELAERIRQAERIPHK